MQLGHFALGPLRIFIFDSREVAIKVDAGITQSNNHGVQHQRTSTAAYELAHGP